MKFSILVPVYNAEKYLNECVDSLVNQTYTGDYEIILVDDGSTDSSGEICDNYLTCYPDKIKVFHQKNSGPVDARNKAIYEAQGEYTIFVDADDFINENTLLTLCKIIDSNSVDIIIYNYNVIAQNTIKLFESISQNGDALYTKNDMKFIYEKLLYSNRLNILWTKAIKTSILKTDTTDYSLYKTKKIGEDWFMSAYHFLKSESVYVVNKALYNYRLTDNGLSHSFNANDIEKFNTLFVYDRLREYLSLFNMETEDNIKKLNYRWIGEVMYNFIKFYETASDKQQKKYILDYDWTSFLPADVIINENEYCRADVNLLYYLWKNKKYIQIKKYFLKRKCRKIYKQIRSR